MQDQIKELLAQVDFETFYRSKVRIKSRSGDEIHGLCPFHDDKESSWSGNTSTGLFNCFACSATGTIFQFIQKLENVSFAQAFKILANFAGIAIELNNPEAEKKKTRRRINPKLPQKYLNSLLEAEKVLQWIQEKKGLSLDTIKKYQIGWDGERNTVPIYDEKGILKNIRLYNRKHKPKMISYYTKNHAYGEGRIYGLDEIKARPKETVYIFEGEWDKLLASQHGFLAVTGTVGAQTFKHEWHQYFAGRDVVVTYDMDPEGRLGSDNACRSLIGTAKTVKNIELPVKGTKEENDYSDFILKIGGTPEDFRKLVEKTSIFTIKEIVKEEGPPKILKSFIEVDLKENIDKRVSVPLTVSGETTEAFHGVSRFRVKECKLQQKGKCNRCPPDRIFTISLGEKELIESCMSSDAQVIGFLRYRICLGGKGVNPRIEILEKSTVREFFATQRTKRFFSRIGVIGVDESGTELVERKVYFVSDKFIKPQGYLATGYIRTHPKSQQVCLLATELKPIDEEFESFVLNDGAKKNLRWVQKLNPEDLVKVLAKEVLFLKQREELILAILLTYCCPLRIRFNEIDIRGWINMIVEGDTGTAKTSAISRFADFVNIGDMVSGLTSSRTGIAYGLKEHKQKGWQIKIGRYPANTRKLVCIDEIQYIKERDTRALAKAMDEGFLTIDRIADKSLESMTRLICLANPKKDQVMDEMMFGCEGFRELFDKAIIRRFDLALCLSHTDIESKELNVPNVPPTSLTVTSRMVRDLIFWIWTRPSESVQFEKAATKAVLEKATELSDKFGHALDIPLVVPGDFANKLARISAAFAALSVSTDENFEQILVKIEHVDFAAALYDDIYSGEAFGLKEYSEIYRRKTQLLDYPEIKKALEAEKEREFHHSENSPSEVKSLTERILYALKMHDIIRRKELADETGSSEKTISRKLGVLKSFNLIEIGSQGYIKRPKFIKFLRKLARDKNTILDVDKPYSASDEEAWES